MDFQDYPEQPRTFSWKPVLIVGAGLLVAVGIIVGVFFLVQHKNAIVSSVGNGTKSLFQNVPGKSQVISACDAVPNPQGCRDDETSTNAATKKDVSLCKSLSSGVKDNCVWGVAVSSNDETICKQISQSSDVNLCSDRIVQSKALAASDETMCDKLLIDADKQNCHNAFLATVTTENCAAKKQDPAYCTFLTITASAVKMSDRDICNTLKDFQVQVCRSHVVFDDPDHDGLSSLDEISIYHTDPRNPDTDGDGYSDGQEVKSGHNPLKKG